MSLSFFIIAFFFILVNSHKICYKMNNLAAQIAVTIINLYVV
jgi:hypothetical protein